SAADIGVVRTAIAVRSSDANPAVDEANSLRAALLAADAVYFPDPTLATAGIHFAKVLHGLALADTLRTRLRPAPNGIAAMRALAAALEPRPIGCTQVTEILHTPGITFAGSLPKPFELVSLYTAAVCTRSRLPTEAARLAAFLGSDAARPMREQAGFGSLR
ncbi:MAG TPA: substrate-binding domain-containing protein, partial [Hyphomicrobiaceae bacterium]|nr:substrate-binding domain-containing protein [Hyphomicrobiaceae bacterium]